MTDEDQRELGAQLARLQQRKLLLRDRIAFVEDQITPDIIA